MIKMPRRGWHWAFLVLGALEIIGIWLRTKDDTLSEYVWAKTQHPVVRSAVGGLAGWLPYHFTYGGGIPLSYRDLIFVGVGAGMGLHSWWIAKDK